MKNHKHINNFRMFNENTKIIDVKVGDNFKFINPDNKSQEIKFVITSLDHQNDRASVRVYYPEINDTIFMISKLDNCEKILPNKDLK